MVDITDKISTHRTAIAQAVVKVGSVQTIVAVEEKKVPKGDVFEMAKTAGLFAAKRTSDMIPDCHPIPIEFTAITFEVKGLEIHIMAEIGTIYKTGVEVEAMHAASVAALTIYDMLKPIDKNITIEQIRLLSKTGGKADFSKKNTGLNASVIVCSDSISNGTRKDTAGRAIIKKLKAHHIVISDYIVIPDETETIQEKVRDYCSRKVNLVILTGGTGLSPRDLTPDALSMLIEKRIPGIEEAIRAYGQQRTPYSMLSRSIAGLIGDTLVLGLPGSTRGAAESMNALFPNILHIFHVLKGGSHHTTNSKK